MVIGNLFAIPRGRYVNSEGRNKRAKQRNKDGDQLPYRRSPKLQVWKLGRHGFGEQEGRHACIH